MKVFTPAPTTDPTPSPTKEPTNAPTPEPTDALICAIELIKTTKPLDGTCDDNIGSGKEDNDLETGGGDQTTFNYCYEISNTGDCCLMITSLVDNDSVSGGDTALISKVNEALSGMDNYCLPPNDSIMVTGNDFKCDTGAGFDSYGPNDCVSGASENTEATVTGTPYESYGTPNPVTSSDPAGVVIYIAPTPYPTDNPTSEPTDSPTPVPTKEPTSSPTDSPTPEPTKEPTSNPTEKPTPSPTKEPTSSPTEKPTPSPTNPPTPEPTSYCDMSIDVKCEVQIDGYWVEDCGGLEKATDPYACDVDMRHTIILKNIGTSNMQIVKLDQLFADGTVDLKEGLESTSIATGTEMTVSKIFVVNVCDVVGQNNIKVEVEAR